MIPAGMPETGCAPELEDIEVGLLLEGLYRHYGHDFRDYAPASLKRRIRHLVQEEGVGSISGLQEKALHDEECMNRLVLALSVKFTTMFRDPGFYVAFRRDILPALKPHPFIRIWHAGCSTGEEVYSMAILLHEEGLYERCRIYATDMNDALVKKAATGIFPLASMRDNTANYLQAGSKRSFSDFYTTKYDGAIFDAALRRNIVFGRHNLASEASFNEFNVILCRNVMIYFNRKLQERVHRLLYGSLSLPGYLGLGNRESLKLTPHEACYASVSEEQRLYRKVM